MVDLNERSYYVQREAKQCAMAASAENATIAAIHHGLADRYAALADEAGGSAAMPRLRVVGAN